MSKKIQKDIFAIVEELVVAIAVVVILFSFVFKVVAVNGNSMLPNLENGDRLVISCINFGYEQGDIVVANEVLENPIIKRVIATEGQTVDIDVETGTVYVDGVALDESQFGLENGMTLKAPEYLPQLEFPTVVPENTLFVLGDNRGVSEDSRFQSVGMIDERNITGKALIRFLPFDKFGGV